MNDPRGALWRKWDLHLHTPSSFDYGNKGVTDQEIIAALKSNGVSVAAITDHHTIDIARIRALQALAGADITILPGLELRSELGGGQSVHFIGIFPEDCDIEEVWSTLQVRLGISPKQVKEKTDERVYCDLADSAKVIHDLGGLVTVHAGRKSNSIERIKNADAFKQALKEDLVKQSIDIFEVGHPDDLQPYRDRVFRYIGVLPMILGSDDHDAKHYSIPHPCWIKADPTFKGLLQVLHEPDDRICVGAEPEKVRLVRTSPTRFIKTVHIERTTGSPLTETWFSDVSLPISHDLTAIIGNKGSGKSALADIVGLLGGSKQEAHFSFLNATKFRQTRGNRARHFQASLEWESGLTVTKGLSVTIEPHEVEAVRYIPQNYLELLCNEIGGPQEGGFDRELEKVIFTHVSAEDRLGCASLKELIDYKTEQLQAAIEILRGELRKVNADIVKIESQLRPTHRAMLESKLKSKQEELEVQRGLEPEPVEEPKSEDSRLQAVATEIEVKTTLLQKYQAAIVEVQAERQERFRRLAVVQRLNDRLDNFQRQFDTFCTECAEDTVGLGIDIRQVVNLSITREPLRELQEQLHTEDETLSKDLDAAYEGSKMSLANALVDEIEDLHGKLDEPNIRYQAYRDAYANWKHRVNAIMGAPEVADSLAYCEAQLAALTQLPEQLEVLQEHRIHLTREIHQVFSKIVGVFRELYRPVQKFIQDHPLIRDRFRLNFEVSLIDTGFSNRFLDFINQSMTGSFAGIDEGRQLVSRLVQKYDLSDEQAVVDFVTDVMSHLVVDMRPDKPRNVDLYSQLRKGTRVEDLYDFVFSLGFLSPRYLLKMGDSLPGQLSPGEKGTLLLIFYLLLDSDGTPLIIDQPEENLDNQTVFELLVPSIKEAKKRRQVVIVTHNPNLAVVCDAEQIIYATLDKAHGFRLSYQSGAIENPGINRHLLDVLEGTLPAFRNRGLKYRSHQEV